MDNDIEYAGFWIRAAAVLIDTIILSFVMAVPLTLIYGANYWESDAPVQGFWDFIFTWVLPLVATIWFWLRYCATPGKIIFKLSIVDANTFGPISISQAVGRYFAYILSALPFFLGYFWVAFDNKKQSWHDRLASTVVICNRKPKNIDVDY